MVALFGWLGALEYFNRRPPARRPQVLTASMTGKDQIAALHTTVIKERPVGLEPHMATQGLNEAEDGEDQGQYDGATDKAGKRSGQGK